MILMRIRIPELLEEQRPPWSAYKLAQQSGGRISLSAAYRLQKARGRVRFLDAELLEALCDVFNVRNLNELLEREAFSEHREVPVPRAPVARPRGPRKRARREG